MLPCCRGVLWAGPLAAVEIHASVGRAAACWAAAASVDPASGTVECHGPMAVLVGGARGGQPGSNVSMTTMGPPQQGQGCAMLGVSSASVLGSVW